MGGLLHLVFFHKKVEKCNIYLAGENESCAEYTPHLKLLKIWIFVCYNVDVKLILRCNQRKNGKKGGREGEGSGL